MKRYLSYLLSVLLVSCVPVRSDNPYASSLCTLSVRLQYPEGHENAGRQGVVVRLEEVNNLTEYTAVTSDRSTAEFRLPRGLYRVSVSDRMDRNIYNGTSDKVRLTDDMSLSLPLIYSKAGSLVIKEIYCGGCTMDPVTGNYQSDKYLILHNNDNRAVYLDSLCFGTLAPYNSHSNNPWGSIQDFAPVIQALWQFGGTGGSFPLNPGEDAVLCLNGAIDHTTQYHLSVNLNKPDYFVCYNNTYFYNTTYHPAPGDRIRQERILDVVEKTGQANAYTFSINSPTAVIFRPEEGVSIREYVKREGSIVQIPGSGTDRVVCIPWEWILDGVEVFNGSATNNNKRMRSDVDAGYVMLSETFKGRSLMRKTDEELSAANGYEVLCDSNNSSEDFYERQSASLHE